MISFNSDMFSTYVIVRISEIEKGIIEPISSETDGKSNDNYLKDEIENGNEESIVEKEETEKSDSVRTYIETSMFIYMLGLGLSLAGIVLYERKRRYNN